MMDERIKYMKALQAFFAKKMGPWQVGDWFVYGDQLYLIIESYKGHYQTVTEDGKKMGFDTPSIDNGLRLPLPIDPRNPERGLWGMVDWNEWHLEPQDQDSVILYGINKNCDAAEFLGTPELALLKALAAQEKVEVEG